MHHVQRALTSCSVLLSCMWRAPGTHQLNNVVHVCSRLRCKPWAHIYTSGCVTTLILAWSMPPQPHSFSHTILAPSISTSYAGVLNFLWCSKPCKCSPHPLRVCVSAAFGINCIELRIDKLLVTCCIMHFEAFCHRIYCSGTRHCRMLPGRTATPHH